MLKVVTMKSGILILGFLLVCYINGKAQSIENVKFRSEDNKTYITYDLIDVKENQQVDIRIFANVRGVDKPIFKVSGDLGKDIVPGTEKTIIWRNNEELTSYNLDEISFKVTVTAKQFYRAAKR